MTLPTLHLDPVAKQVELNTVTVRGLSDAIRELLFENRNVSDNEGVVDLSSSTDSLQELVRSAECRMNLQSLSKLLPLFVCFHCKWEWKHLLLLETSEGYEVLST